MLRHLLARQNGADIPKLDPAFLAESRTTEILAIQSAIFAVASAVVLLRVYCRVFMLRAFSVDDYFMLAAVGCAIATLVTFIGETRHGLGRHLKAVSPQDFAAYSKYIWFNAIFIVIGISLVKVSLGFFLLRVAQRNGWRRFIIGMIVFLALFTLACVGTLICQCIPPSAAWNFSLRATAKCYPIDTYIKIGIFNSSINIATDFIFATIPIPMFWSVQMKLQKKIILMSILSLGYFACAAAVVKAVLQGRFGENPDVTWNTDYFMWNSIEFHVGIITASLPTLRPLFKSLLDAASTVRSSPRGHPQKANGYYGGSNIALSSRGAVPSDIGGNAARINGGGRIPGSSRRVDKYGWDYSRRSSTDESFLDGQSSNFMQQGPQKEVGMPGGATTAANSESLAQQQPSILRTTEVSVTSHTRKNGREQPSRSILARGI